MKNKLWLLLKVQLRETFLPRSETHQDERKTRRRAFRNSAISLWVGDIIFLVFSCVIFFAIGSALQETPFLEVIPAIGVAGASIFCLLTTIYKTNGLLFGYRDYELTMAMPFPTSTIVASRVLILYTWNLMTAILVLLPAGISYGFFSGAGVGFWIIYFIEMLLVPLLPSVLATVVGTAIAAVSTRVQHRGVAGMVLSVAFMIAWMMFVARSDDIMSTLAVQGQTVIDGITRVWPPAAWFIKGCCNLDIAMFLLFAGVSVGAFVFFVAVVAKYFRSINSALAAKRTRSDFVLGNQHSASAEHALLRKEWKRFTGSTPYLLNTGISYIFCVVLAIIFVALGPLGIAGVDAEATAEIAADMAEGGFSSLIGSFCFIFAFMLNVAPTTAVSISLEGRSLWIIKSMPISSWQILRTKLRFNMLLVAAATAVSGTIMLGVPGLAVGTRILFYVVPLVYGAFATVYGQTLNLAWPNFDWTNEVYVAKQSKPVVTCVFTALATCMVPMFITEFMAESGGMLIAILVTAGVGVATIILYRRLRTKGVARFESLSN